MILGTTATALTFVSLVISLASYYFYHRSQISRLLSLARVSFYTSSFLVLFQAVLLMWGILTHHFEWQYVFSYSSRDLSVFYLISTFWGGQEGTFLLWLLLGSIYGVILIRKRNRNEALTMFFIILVQAFLTIILVKKNPFTYVWDINPARFQAGIVPVDGNGLNPLLQDPWMIIHPPILFIGYSSTMILFAYAMMALLRKEYTSWVKEVFPFALFTALSLGSGIILGGYWAYTTLGWGGYWGWDPVENSSLIPWLVSLAFLHGLIIQRRQGGLKRFNIILALLTFLLVLYGSFLTRSGILADFSVHSFSTSVIFDYLVALFIFFFVLSGIGYFIGTRQFSTENVAPKLFTRATFMLFGMLCLLLSAIFTFFGTSAPLFTDLFTGTAANVSIEYYNLLNTPVAILIGILLSLSPLMSWKDESAKLVKRLLPHILFASVAGVSAYFLGLKDLIPFLLFLFFVFAISVNSQIVINMIRKKQYGLGGYISHVGVGLMIIGIIASSVYEKTTKVALPFGSEKNVLGYDMKYLGFRIDRENKDEAVIQVSHASLSEIEATPKFYWSEFNQAFMRNPSVHNLWIKDLYISPIQVIPADQVNSPFPVRVSRGESKYFEDYVFHFTGYEMSGHEEPSGNINVKALFTVVFQGEEYHIKPGLIVSSGQRNLIPAILPATDRHIHIQEIHIDEDAITIGIERSAEQFSDAQEYLAVEITEKPLINILWLGTILMISGFFIQIIHRSKLKRY